MAYNLARNSRVFVTTNVSTASGQTVAAGGVSAGLGEILAAGFSTVNTFEVQVLDGFKFGQTVASQNVQVKEAGNSPVRGQRSFNTALNPVDISFSTYIRPRLNAAQATAEERNLWNYLMGYVGIEGTGQAGATITAGTGVGPLTLSGTLTTASAVRATTTAAAVTVTSALTLTPTPVIGEIFTIKGLTGTGAATWQGPVKITGYTAGTSVSFEYLEAPNAASTTASPVFTTATKFDRAAWNEYAVGTGITTSYSSVSTANSNKNQLQTFGMIFYVDGQWYGIDNCAMDQAQIDFGLDAIAMTAWTAKGTKLSVLTAPTGSDLTQANPILGTAGSLAGTATGKVTTANFITNKLSTTTVMLDIGGTTTSYAVPVTGGSITIANGITYVTPAIIGTLNKPIGYFTGNRAISGTLNAYLKAGTGVSSTYNTGDLLSKILTVSNTSTETKFALQVEVGGSSNPIRVEFDIPGAMLTIPSVDIADIVSTSIGFTAQSYDPVLANNAYDIERTNDLTVRYYSV